MWILNLFKPKNELKRLIKKADNLFKKDHRQYFVMPLDGKNRYILCHGRTFLDNYNRIAKKKRIKKMSYIDMINICAYKTPNGTNIK